MDAKNFSQKIQSGTYTHKKPVAMKDKENTMRKFISRYKFQLIKSVHLYLNNKITHDEIKELAWFIIDEYEKTKNFQVLPYLKGEKTFWALVWNLILLADEGHWNEGITQKDIVRLVNMLQNGKELPIGEDARRPMDR